MASSTGYASTRQAKAFAETLSTEFLNCRRYGHTFRPFTVTREGRAFIETTKCKDCRSLRKETLSSTGASVKRHISYAEGYLTDGIGRIVGDARNAVRLVSALRQVDDGDATVIQLHEAKRPATKKAAARQARSIVAEVNNTRTRRAPAKKVAAKPARRRAMASA